MATNRQMNLTVFMLAPGYHFDSWRMPGSRAEELGHNAAYRETYQMVVARSFGPPAVLAECASPLLLPGGTLIVSEPPHSEADRWPASGLAKLGLRKVETVRVTGVRLAILEKTAPLDSRWPRRVGIPAKRPVF